jgi:hypothetical protein
MEPWEGEEEAWEEPDVKSVANPEAVKRARSQAEREAREAAAFWKAVFSNKIGRRVMWRLLMEDCNGFSPPFACGPNGFPQTEATWFQAGQYALGQRLYQRWLAAEGASVAQMHRENDPAFAPRRRRRRNQNGENL